MGKKMRKTGRQTRSTVNNESYAPSTSMSKTIERFNGQSTGAAEGTPQIAQVSGELNDRVSQKTTAKVHDEQSKTTIV